MLLNIGASAASADSASGWDPTRAGRVGRRQTT
jgi:hypothetical protein